MPRHVDYKLGDLILEDTFDGNKTYYLCVGWGMMDIQNLESEEDVTVSTNDTLIAPYPFGQWREG